MRLPSTQNINNKAVQEIIRKGLNGAKCVGFQTKQVSPHIHTMTGVFVDPVKRKSEYLPDILSLMKNGVPIKQIASLFSMSSSYIYKLISKK